MSDTALVNQIIAGIQEAFRTLVDLHHYKVINTCYRFVYNKEDAEDLTQEVFIEIYRSVSGFREEAQLSTWIYRIAVSKSLDFLRKQKRKKRLGTVCRFIGLGEEAEQAPAPVSDDPEQALEKRERLQILQEALDLLADNQRVAFTLSKSEGYSYQEIAEIMNTSLSAVESLIHRAKKNLEKKLNNYFDRNP